MQIGAIFNYTPFVAAVSIVQDKDGGDYAVALLKATFTFNAHGVIQTVPHAEMVPVFYTDQYDGPPENSRLSYPADIVLRKLGTDVIVNGHAYAHGARHVVVGVEVSNVDKRIACFGARQWTRSFGISRIGAPAMWDKIPLGYASAFGGVSTDGDQPEVYAFNPVGRGYRATPANEHPLPALEYPHQLIASLKNEPAPAALAALPSHWPQRRQYAGTYDAVWTKTRRPLLPENFDDRFFHAVAEDQIVRPALRGGEKVVLSYLCAEQPRVEFKLPSFDTFVTFQVKTQMFRESMQIDTLVIEPDEHRFIVVLRASLPLHGNSLFFTAAHFESTPSTQVALR